MTRPLLTVIVPVYNEARTIDELLARVMESATAKEIIVVNDASTDGTTDKLEIWMGRVTVITHPANRGKGAAIRTGLEHARGIFTLIQDADLEYDPGDYEPLLAPLLTGEADVVYGSRYLTGYKVLGPRSKLIGGNCAGSGDPRTTTQPECFISRRTTKRLSTGSEMTTLRAGSGDPRTTTGDKLTTPENESGDESPHSKARWSVCRWGVTLLNSLVRCLYGVRISDEATCYKVFRTDDLRAMDLQCEGFEFCPEVTAKACRMGLRIAEVPIRYTPRAIAQGKKIRWRDGWTGIKTLWRWRHWRPQLSRLQPHLHIQSRRIAVLRAASSELTSAATQSG